MDSDSGFSDRIRRLTPEQRELLLRGMSQRDSPAPRRRIPRRDRSDDGPLSFAQQQLWFMDHAVDPGSAYQMPLLLQFRGSLERPALERALQAVIDRHDVLRAVFPSIDGQPRQRIVPRLNGLLQEIDLSRHAPDRKDVELRRLLQADRRRRFSLAAGPLLRATLLRLTADEHLLMLTLHHIVADGWSLGILTAELAACYTAELLGFKPELAPLAIQFSDFAAWEQSRWAAGDFESELTYWTGRLDGLVPLRLPADSAAPAVRSFRGGSESLALSPLLSQRLQAFCRAERVTLFTTLLAALYILLSRFSGRSDIAVGTPVAGRRHAELEPLIGCFVNTLILRANLGLDPPFCQFLRDVGDTVLNDFAHQDLPFDRLVERLRPARDLARNPLVQVFFAVQNAPMHAFEMPRLQVSFLETRSETARFELEFNVWETAQGIRIIAGYNADLFRSATVAQLLRHYQVLLEGILHDPSRRVTALPLPAEGQSQQSLQTWNWTVRSSRPDIAAAENLCSHSGAQPPQTDLERQIAATWAAMLGVPVVGREDDFFQLGGDSLQAARTIRRLRDLLQIPLDVKDIFKARTVRDFASHVEAVRWARGSEAGRESAEEFDV